MALRRFALREAHGSDWLWWGEKRETYPDLPFFPQLDDRWRYGTVVVDWPVHYSRAIENQLDVAHLPFVHRSTIGGGGRSLVEGPHVEDDGSGIRVWVTNARDGGQASRSCGELAAAAVGKEPGLSFLFPVLWLLNISPRLKNFIAFVPISAQQTRYYLRVYHRHRAAIVAKPFEMLMGISNRVILRQDRKVMVTQPPADSSTAGDDRLIGADRAIVKFRQQLARLLKQTDCREPTGANQPARTDAKPLVPNSQAGFGRLSGRRFRSDRPRITHEQLNPCLGKVRQIRRRRLTFG
jgi:phenylpropionate dioxygenase-like ring-hydroxylating dioxygenase large terminal subunit